MERPGSSDLSRSAESLAARLPAPLAVLSRLAANFRWSWHPEGPRLFQAIDPHRWELCGENPVRMLQEASMRAIARVAEDAAFLARADALEREIAEDLARPFAPGPISPQRPAVFFCSEFGIHASLPLYSGGLGVLAGDFLKAASDAALPLVAVGLMYRKGYFRQRIDLSGWQHEYWVDTDPERLPTALVTDRFGLPVTVQVPIRGIPVRAQIWRIDVGRIPLYLLDTERPENSRHDRWITAQLYVGNRCMRLAQYLLLGVGGMRALRALGIDPGIVHLNEGHAALAPLELARAQEEAGASREDAFADARSRTVFTTHTPVPAGNETYSDDELATVLGDLPDELGLGREAFVGMGRTRSQDRHEPFGLTQLGLRVSRAANGVSRRHGGVAREMWHGLFPERSLEDVPIGFVTNGVHVATWMATPLRELLARYLGSDWESRSSDPGTWAGIEKIPDEELWAVRNQLRGDLVAYVRDRSVADRLNRNESHEYVEAAARCFDPEVLTVGFARRLATYKRLHLLVYDVRRALRMIAGPRPVQFLLAGKAHPADDEAKEVVKGLFTVRGHAHVGERVAFLHDYDMGVAQHLVQGCDVWLNAPRPPLEASGTSGMKSALNGGLQLSVLDGWWAEAYDGSNGWAVSGEVDHDTAAQDARDATAFSDLLESEVIPSFYERDATGLPRAWLARIKASLRSLGPVYDARRMVSQYVEEAYTPRR